MPASDAARRSGGDVTERATGEEWTIERLVPGGDGMAHLSDGRVGFANRAFPGDVVRPVAVEAKKGHVRATGWELVRASQDRVQSVCPVAERCGGCDWMGLSRKEQLVGKEGILRQALARIGKFGEVPEPLSIEAVGEALGYRSRVRFHVDERGRVGFFARRSRTLVEVARCPVCDPRIDGALALLLRLPSEHLAPFSEIDVRVADVPEPIAIRFVPRAPGVVPKAARQAISNLSDDFVLHFEGSAHGAPRDQVFRLPGPVSLFASPGVFTQVNWKVNEALVEAVVRGARARRISRFCDLYAGAGNFALPLLAAGMRGVAVERDRRAVASAHRAAKAAGFDTDVFTAGDAAPFLRDAVRRKERFDVVLLDPPRQGAKDVLTEVVALAPPYVLFCSCDPVTLARDLGSLARAGYALDEVRGFDMFPETHHFETLAWMSRTVSEEP